MTKKIQVTGSSIGAYYLFIGNLVAFICSALTAIIVGRLLGPEKYGLYTIALIVPTYVYLLSQWGLPTTITRFVSKYSDKESRNKAISFAYAITTFGCAISFVFILSLVPFLGAISTDFLNRPELAVGIIMPIALLGVLGQSLFYNGNAAFVGLREFKKSANFQIVMAASKLGTSVFLILAGFSVLGAVIGNTLAFLVAGSIALILLILANRKLAPINVKDHLKSITRYTSSVYASVIAISIVPTVQNTILTYAVSNTQIGWYTAAVNVSTIINIFYFPISTALLPVFSKDQINLPILAKDFRFATMYAVLFIAPVTLFMMALSAPFVVVLFGRMYLPSGNYLRILTIVDLLACVGTVCSTFLYGVGKTRNAIIAGVVFSVVSIVTSWILSLVIGVNGVIVGTILGELVFVILTLRFVSNFLESSLGISFVLRIYFCSGLSAALVYVISLFIGNPLIAIIVSVPIFLVTFIPFIAWTRAVSSSDLHYLQVTLNESRPISFIIGAVIKYYSIFSKVDGRK